MSILDTLIWLVNFPASHGYAMVFIGGFSILGLFAMSVRGDVPGGALRRIREREGLLREQHPRRGEGAARVMRLGFRVLAFLMIANVVIGVLSLTGVPVTRAYIYEHGERASATLDGDWVTFTTHEGVEYTLESNFFTPAVYPDRDAYFPSDGQISVRYLKDHPQAFVIDSTQGRR
ncbi:hypothetical protein [Microbacterium sp.]|uniref:hypothetical protein n=1 Tax=Microbacterium sp. TaxID=51671 RepID=UPI0039E4784B